MNTVQDRRRAADRLRWEALIRSHPAPARFRDTSAPVLILGEPGKLLTMRSGGFDPGYSIEVVLVQPTTDTRPPAANEYIDVQDLSGATQTYQIKVPTPLEGHGCYRLGLMATRGKPRSAIPGT